jgi:hypothetical protein
MSISGLNIYVEYIPPFAAEFCEKKGLPAERIVPGFDTLQFDSILVVPKGHRFTKVPPPNFLRKNGIRQLRWIFQEIFDKYTERDSKIEISAVPKPRDSTIASHLIESRELSHQPKSNF